MNKNSFEFFERFRNNAAYRDIDKPIIIADDLRTPENMGAVLRLAGNIGASETLFISDKAHEFKNYKINRTASGGEKKTDWRIIAKEDAILKDLLPQGYQIVALETDSNASNLMETRLPDKCAFLIGNEVSGISEDLMHQAKQAVFIPVPGPVSSLNVTHALSVALFEWLRQRNIAF